MKHLKSIFILSLLSLVLISNNVQAKWWIFGQSQDEIEVLYLYLNKVSLEESRTKITLYRESLEEGMIHIRGEARVRTGQIGSVRISLDDKDSWHDARLSRDGAFSYDFRAEEGKTYIIYVEIMDTKGKTNDVDATRKEVLVSDRDMRALIQDVLSAMVEAYRDEDPQRFMNFVSEDFIGDEATLDRAVRKDFSAFDNIHLRFIMGTLASNEKGMIFVNLNFNRQLISSRSGESLSDRGTTQFVFQSDENGPKVYAMKNPLIFGLSEASEVATGAVVQTSNNPIIVVDDRGNASEKPFDEALRIISGEEDDADIESGTGIALSVPVGGHPPAGFNFADATVGPIGADFVITGHSGPVTAYGFLSPGALIRDLGMRSLNDVTEAPATGYLNHTPPHAPTAIDLIEGHTYAFQLPGPCYALLYIRSVSLVPPMGVDAMIDYKYRPDGSRGF